MWFCIDVKSGCTPFSLVRLHKGGNTGATGAGHIPRVTNFGARSPTTNEKSKTPSEKSQKTKKVDHMTYLIDEINDGKGESYTTIEEYRDRRDMIGHNPERVAILWREESYGMREMLNEIVATRMDRQ